MFSNIWKWGEHRRDGGEEVAEDLLLLLLLLPLTDLKHRGGDDGEKREAKGRMGGRRTDGMQGGSGKGRERERGA